MGKKKIAVIVIDILVLIACVVLAYFLSNWMFGKINVSGASMEKTIHNDDTVILFKQGKYKRGDIVVFNTHKLNNKGQEKYYIKRIIAMEGDTVEIGYDDNGAIRIFVNDEVLEEKYLGDNMPAATETDIAGKIVVPEGQFYFCGDNRLVSDDSRGGLLGYVGDILGRVIIRYPAENGLIDFIKRPSEVAFDDRGLLALI